MGPSDPKFAFLAPKLFIRQRALFVRVHDRVIDASADLPDRSISVSTFAIALFFQRLST
jgi:hypothetical protein